ncbi:MAG: adenylate/guanylate cyclase domain-containing protein [Gammaproteobacteria bacterium]
MLGPPKLERSPDAGTDPPSPVPCEPARHPWITKLLAQVRKLRPSHAPIAYKLAFVIALLITLGMALLGSIIISNQTRLLRAQIDTFGRTVVQQMAESAKEPLLANDTLGLEVLATNLSNGANVLGTAIFSNGGTVMAHAGVTPFTTDAPFAGRVVNFLDGKPHELDWRWARPAGTRVDAVSFLSPVRFKNVVAGYVLISFSREAMTQAVGESVRAIVTATVFMILLGLAMSYVMGRKLSRPIINLMDASRAFGQGHYDFRFLERRHDEIGYLMNSFSKMAEGLLQKAQVESVFRRYVSRSVAQAVLSDLEQVKLGGQHVHASVVFADIVGFTALSERMNPTHVADLLNEFYSYTSRIAEIYGGMVDKYIGDCAMLIFGVQEQDDRHGFRALCCAVLLQRLMERLNQRRSAAGIPPVRLRIGVNTGDMLAGNIGTRERMQYTVVGDAVNLASRLCSVAEPGTIAISGEVLAQPEVANRVRVREHRSIHLRGISRPVNTYLVRDVTPRYRKAMGRRIESLLRENADAEATEAQA